MKATPFKMQRKNNWKKFQKNLKKVLTNKKTRDNMHKVAEGTKENKATRKYLKG